MQSTTLQSGLEQLEKKLSNFFFDLDNVTLAYLFGSTVRGEANCLSDIDIAVLFDEGLTKKEIYSLQLKLFAELGHLLKTDNVDLVVLNDSPLLLTYNIISNGIILKSDERKRVPFETGIISMYLDRSYYFERHRKKALERMAKGRVR